MRVVATGDGEKVKDTYLAAASYSVPGLKTMQFLKHIDRSYCSSEISWYSWMRSSDIVLKSMGYSITTLYSALISGNASTTGIAKAPIWSSFFYNTDRAREKIVRECRKQSSQ